MMIKLNPPMISDIESYYINIVLSSGFLTRGDTVHSFESRIGSLCNAPYVVAVSSGTTALHCALLAVGIKPGDEVVTSPFTFISTINMIRHVGAIPVFVDIELDTLNIDCNKIEKVITRRTKAILTPHIYGGTCELDKAKNLSNKYGLVLIEDACQAIGAMYNGKHVGTIGDIGVFSFYATKNLTCGEGGAIVTNKNSLRNTCSLLRDHCQVKQYVYDGLGFNYRMPNLSAAIGLGQCDKFRDNQFVRASNASLLISLLKGNSKIKLPVVRIGCVHAWHQFAIQVENRDYVKKQLLLAGIQTGVFYPKVIDSCNCENAEQAASKVLSLPISPNVTNENINYIAETLNGVVK